MADTLLITNRDKTLRALQEIQLVGLKELDRICRKYDIKYSLGGGTCLGQIRHGGFIPWDDDIDIDMTSENYKKFLEIAPKELDPNRFFLRSNKTDKKHKRSNSRLEMKMTTIGLKQWDKEQMKVGIFIDIMEWNYLPDNKFLRRIVSSALFYLRCMENYKMFHVCARKIEERKRTLFVIFCKLMPTCVIMKLERLIQGCCGKKKTGWIMDNAIINGNHGGYPSNGIDEYEDVYFEGIKVMNKKNSHNFMRTIYGDNYNEWLKPISRISHHYWTKMNYGVYKEYYDIPKNYEDYLTIKYNPKKLEHMQKISFEMLKEVDRICKKNNIKYYLIGLDAYIKGNSIDEYGKFWREPLKIAMTLEDYNKFAEISQKYLGEKYFYQSNKTDFEYKYPYARIRLNLTSIREAKITKIMEERYNNGFFIKIIPLVSAPDNTKERKKYIRDIRYLNHFIDIKWRLNNFRAFMKSNYKYKLKLIYLLLHKVDKLNRKLELKMAKYENSKTNYYVDGTGYQIGNVSFKKEIFGDGEKKRYNGYMFMFPRNIVEYIETIEKNKITKRYKTIRHLNWLKNNFKKSYLKKIRTINSNEIKIIQKKYPACFLNYFDLPEYQLSILRYDEKTKKLLSNKKILGYK